MPHERYDFPNHAGHMLAGRLEMPDHPPRAFALFAHCFACTSKVKAATRISRAMCDRGIAVLRFDFTGLGDSEGDFANANFSSNVDDLVAAAEALTESHAAPQLLIGHSLGGAAVLLAAQRLSDVRAVATIAAPSDPAHVTHLLSDQLDAIERDGQATIELGGRHFPIAKQFVDDLQSHRLLEAMPNLRRPLLIYHAPGDNVVGIDHARQLFDAAKHPKSFISLDQADHLIRREEDADFIAETLTGWCTRYLDEPVAPAGDDASSDEAEPGVMVREIGEPYAQQVRMGRHTLQADEPKTVGGGDTGPNPYDLLLAALGSCTSMTLRMYADHKDWPLEHVTVALKHDRIHAGDSEQCAEAKKTGKIDRITRSLTLTGPLSGEQRDRLLEIAERCPVHRTLQSCAEIVTAFAESDARAAKDA